MQVCVGDYSRVLVSDNWIVYIYMCVCVARVPVRDWIAVAMDCSMTLGIGVDSLAKMSTLIIPCGP